MMKTPKLTDKITVCAACSTASCWHGMFCCDNNNPETKQITIKEALELDLDHPNYIFLEWALHNGLEETQIVSIFKSLLPDENIIGANELRKKLLEVMKEDY